MFKPIQLASLCAISLKTDSHRLLLMLTSVKRVVDLQERSIDDSCIEFGPGDFRVTLKPWKGYVPKVISTPFKVQVLILSAFPHVYCKCGQRTHPPSLSHDLSYVPQWFPPCIDVPPIQCFPYQLFTL